MALILTPGIVVGRQQLTYMNFNLIAQQGRNYISVGMLLYPNVETRKLYDDPATMGVTFEWSDANAGLPNYSDFFNDELPIKKQIYKAIPLYGAALNAIVEARESDPERLAKAKELIHAKYKNVTLSTMEDDDEETTGNSGAVGTPNGGSR